MAADLSILQSGQCAKLDFQDGYSQGFFQTLQNSQDLGSLISVFPFICLIPHNKESGKGPSVCTCNQSQKVFTEPTPPPPSFFLKIICTWLDVVMSTENARWIFHSAPLDRACAGHVLPDKSSMSFCTTKGTTVS